jgi:hypothetical protein
MLPGSHFIVDTTINDIFKTETAERISSEPFIQFRIIYRITIASPIKDKFVLFCDGIEVGCHLKRQYGLLNGKFCRSNAAEN